MRCDTAGVIAGVRRAAEAVAAHRDELVDLDKAIGDGDHGENLKRGFGFVVDALDSSTFDTPGAVLKMVATTLISKVGGASGPLYGTAFLRAATLAGEAPEIDLVAALQAALGGIVDRGKAVVGDKTIVDALAPAVEAGLGGATLAGIADAADEGAASTVALVARKGRASYLGQRSAGHLDPGARSTAIMLRAFAGGGS
ncbi:dihydroxyacetone kinase subunit DhaL [Actinokineospora sp. UTMC 2448]|uniref:dihydroxyacetone kinase subunit DhaL n=1 Tax=Actinokineospora sp. UTMC 2448 TaxID=2268449 RepID=UPI002164A863|nr:dihydroxyacetone kinase subunit DhaL [Actinokineospora sp. UTMC 2448]UVS81343.1 PTS-dependent dihydroxyacetone kinase, ADP-binding subunit DhaL [Actinokineospora sp. UTMC 2448]